jgi:PhzF family phenazine biosynthesis protein
MNWNGFNPALYQVCCTGEGIQSRYYSGIHKLNYITKKRTDNMAIPVYYIDTFTSVCFKGNPTAICLLYNRLPNATLQAIAQELNLPVTGFVDMSGEGGAYRLRYFTVTGEIPACGHATLAAANVMAKILSASAISFITMEDLLIATRLGGNIAYLQYPRYPTVSLEMNSEVLSSLGLSDCQQVDFCAALETLFITIESPAILRSLQPDYKWLKSSTDSIKEVVVTCVSDDAGYDFLLRSFCPWIGIDEDPVTGSVHAVLAHHWGNRLGKPTLRAYQASERGGAVYVQVLDNGVELGGESVTVMEGFLNL